MACEAREDGRINSKKDMRAPRYEPYKTIVAVFQNNDFQQIAEIVNSEILPDSNNMKK